MKTTNVQRDGALSAAVQRGERAPRRASSLGITVEDDTTEAHPVRVIHFEGASVTDDDDGLATVTIGGGGGIDADSIDYDNTVSGLTADDVQEAIDELAAATGGGGELDYVEITTGDSSITATTEGTAETLITGTSQAYAAVPVMIEVFFPQARTDSGAAGRTLNFILFDGATVLGQIGELRTVAASALGVPVLMRLRMTPSAATHQFLVKAYVSAGTALVGASTGGTGNLVAAYIRVTLA